MKLLTYHIYVGVSREIDFKRQYFLHPVCCVVDLFRFVSTIFY